MKHLLTIFTLLLFFQIHAQDTKWYVKNKCYMETPAVHASTQENSRDCHITKVSHPYRTSTIPPNDTARNDLFIIFQDGKHFNSRYLDLEPNKWDDWSANGDSSYYLKTSTDISHLYFTNVYEGNDEPDAITTPHMTALSTLHSLSNNGNSMISSNVPPSALTSNHTPVPGRDLTLIIEHKDLESQCTYELCYTITPPEEREKKSSSQLAITPANIFGLYSNPTRFVASGGGPAGLVPRPYFFNPLKPNCISGLNFDSSEDYTYINLNISEDPDSLLANSQLSFTLSGPPGCSSESLIDTIKNSHDPNFVMVKCVSRVEGAPTNTVHYKAQCMNDGDNDQDDPSIELTFPFAVSPGNITITGAKIRDKVNLTTYNILPPQVVPDPFTANRIKFEFLGNLAFCEIPSEEAICIAWVEFCIEIPSSYNVLTESLQPYDRNTNFGNDPYIIDRYIDLDCDSIFILDDPTIGSTGTIDPNVESEIVNKKDDRPKKDELESSEELLMGHWKCERPNEVCNCTPIVKDCSKYAIICNGIINWTMLICVIILILILLWLLTKFFRKG